MKSLSIKEVANACSGIATAKGDIDSVFTDSRKPVKNGLFVAIEGENFDGHNFIDTAISSGASAVMCSKPVNARVPLIIVDDTREALLKLAAYYRSLFSVNIIGLTGSVGKTTTKEMVWLALSEKFKTLKTMGNLNNEIGLPMTLFNLDETYQAAVIEMGMSNRGEISKLSSTTKPDVALITNIGVSHIENLGSRENILKAKLEILDGMKKGSTIILNKDNDLLRTSQINDYKPLFFGIDNKNADVVAFDIIEKNEKTSFSVKSRDGVAKITIPVVGIHNVYNALAAICVGMIFNVSADTVNNGLAKYNPTGMRQRIQKFGSITIIEDCYNSSPDSVKAALDTLASIKAKRKIAVLGDMLELGIYSKKAHRLSGEYAAKTKTDILFAYGKNSEDTAKAAVECGMKNVFIYDDAKALAIKLSQFLKDGDAVLFKASRGIKLEDVFETLYPLIERK